MKSESGFSPKNEGGQEETLNKIEDRIEKVRSSIESAKERGKPLPDKLYHVTTREDYYNIMNNGLQPSSLMFEDKEVVSLSDEVDYARDIVETTQADTHHNSLVVLEIDTDELEPKEVDNYLREEDPEKQDPIESAEIHEAHYNKKIPPKAISFKEEIEINR